MRVMSEPQQQLPRPARPEMQFAPIMTLSVTRPMVLSDRPRCMLLRFRMLQANSGLE